MISATCVTIIYKGKYFKYMQGMNANLINLNPTSILPGGSEPTVFDPLEAWYPIYYLDDLDRTKLSRFTLLDLDF